MKANARDMLVARRRIELLRGQEVYLKVNEGRNRIVGYSGIVDKMYDGIFTVKSVEDGKIFSYPYSDLITKNVRFLKK